MAELRHRQPQLVDSLLQEEYLAAEEQEEVIQQLKTWHRNQSKIWTGVFAALAGLLGAGCWYLAMQQTIDPWGLRHHAYFYHTLEAYCVSAGEACNGVSFLLNGIVLVIHAYDIPKMSVHAWQKSLLYVSVLCVTATAVFWLIACTRAAAYQEDSIFDLWRYMWLPLGPVAYLLLCCYLLSTFGRTQRDIDALRGSMYNLHSA